MANSINQAVEGQERTGIQALRDTGRIGYRAARIETPGVAPSALSQLASFAKQGVQAYGAYRQASMKRADARSDEIIRKLTPEQRRQARADGKLLYQDDADTMAALATKVGRNAAYELDSSVQELIPQNKFKSQEDLQTYLTTRRNDAAKSYAEANGIDPEDVNFKRGYDADITHRNAAMFDSMAQHLSKRHMATMAMQTASEMGSLLDDPQVLRGDQGPAQFAQYINHGLETGGISDEQMAVSSLQQALQANSTRPGADKFFQNIGDQTINLYGKPQKIRDVIGDDHLSEFTSRAAQATFSRNRELSKNWTVNLQNAQMNPDTSKGLQTLDDMYQQLQAVQGSDVNTPQVQQLFAARAAILQQQQQQIAQRSKEMTKAQQADNRQELFESRFAQKIRGENVSTDPSTFPTDENTGKITEEDGANFANAKLQQIDANPALSDAQKTAQKLAYIRADDENGPFRKMFQGLATGAAQQYQGLVASNSTEVTDENTDQIKNFVRIYQSDPATMAAIFPEQSAFAERVMYFAQGGIGLPEMVDGDRRVRASTKTEQDIADQKWNDLTTGSDATVPYMPLQLNQAARTIFNAVYVRTGDERAAGAATNDWLGKTTVTFGNSTRTQGVITKNALMVDPQDPTSWQQGQTIINSYVDALVKANPHLSRDQITIQETAAGIRITDPTGAIKMSQPITTKLLREQYAHQQKSVQAQREQAKDDKINQYRQEANRRAQLPFGDKKLDPSIGTLEGALGFRDNQ